MYIFIYRRNINTSANSTYFIKCRFKETDSLYCPVFSLGQIIDMIQPTRTIKWKQTVANISVKVCSIYLLNMLVGNVTSGNWASEASPTLGCSIEILRDIYIYVSVVYQNA